jgi:hypothetical protein
MKKQIILIAFFTVGIAMIEACFCFTSCGCGGAADTPDFFNFEKLTIEHQQNIGTESLRLILLPDSIEYLAMGIPSVHWNGWLPAAYGCSPEDPGWSGLKFPLSQINITADQTFNDTLLAGASLNALFRMANNVTFSEKSAELKESDLASLQDLSSFPPFGNGPGVFLLVTDAVPTHSNLPFKFTITLTKGDQTVVSATTEEILF